MHLKQGMLDISTSIHKKANIKSSVRRWKDKLKEWGCKKNMTTDDMQWIVAKGTKRAREGKDTDFFHGGIEVTTQRIENFKRRKTGEVPDSMRELFYTQNFSALF
jgi:hypothetical protein